MILAVVNQLVLTIAQTQPGDTLVQQTHSSSINGLADASELIIFGKTLHKVYYAGVLFCLHLEQRLLMVQNRWLTLSSLSVQKPMLLTSFTLENRRVRKPFFLKNRLCPWLHIEHIFRSFFFFSLNLLLDWNTREHSAAVCFQDYLKFLCELCFWDKIGGGKCSINKELTRRGNTGKEGTRFLY